MHRGCSESTASDAESTGAPGEEQLQVSPPDAPAPVILIVDDTPENIFLLEAMLQEKKYRVRTAANGTEALDSARSLPPDLILLDILMPGMNGFEVCRLLQADEQTRHIPVIFISALDEVSDKLSAFALGGVDYVTKPFQTEEVLARVNTHLTLRALQLGLRQRNQQLQAEIAERKRAEQALQQANQELGERNRQLEEALAKVKTLSGLLPICSSCKRIRDDEGYWTQVEVYISNHAEVGFSHGICPECVVKLYPDLFEEKEPSEP